MTRTRATTCSPGRLKLIKGASADELVETEIGPGHTWRNQPGEIHTIEAIEDAAGPRGLDPGGRRRRPAFRQLRARGHDGALVWPSGAHLARAGAASPSVLLLVVALLAVVAVVAVGPGSYETYPRSSLLTAAGQREAPAWTRPCWALARKRREPTCVHVSGRVVWIQHDDPDGDGDRHLVIVGRLHPRIVKISTDASGFAAAGLRPRIDAVGYLFRGSSGKLEVIAARLVPGGPALSVLTRRCARS